MSAANLIKMLKSPSGLIDGFIARPAMPEKICTTCGYRGVPVRKKKGRDQIETLIWVVFVLCAIMYVLSMGAHHLSHFRFPGLIVRFFSLFGKLFFAFGVVYTVWQLSTEYEACPKCEHATMIPPDSPKADGGSSHFS